MKEYVASAKNRKEEHQGAYDRENGRKLSELLEMLRSAVTGRSCPSNFIVFANLSVLKKPRSVYCKIRIAIGLVRKNLWENRFWTWLKTDLT